MDLILSVFEKLNIDQTAFIQFGVMVMLYFPLKTILFNKLQFVLELRESKTTKMEENANKKFVQANQLSEKYRAELDKAYNEAQGKYHGEKQEIVEREKRKIKEKEADLNQNFEKRKNEFVQELEQKKTEVLASADELAGDLVNKIVQ